MALEELRTRGESRIELRIVDSESDPEKAGEHLRRLYRDGVLAAIGGLRPAEARAMASVAEERERVLVRLILSINLSCRHHAGFEGRST